ELQGRVDNPQKNRVGNFGHDLAVDDGNGDGKDDLFVVAIGNRAEDGQDRAGQIFYYPGPITGAPARVIESPVRKAGDVARFGMNIHVRDLNGDGCADLAVGSPRSDAGEVEDAGLGFLFRGPKFDPTKALMKIRSDPKPRKNDIVGFRTRMGNLLGDSSPDLIFSSLADPRYGHARALLIWDGSRIEGKLFVLEAMPGASDHYIQGISIAQLNGKGYEELILGDPNHNPEVGKNVGRVMIACFDESSF
ncbi:MAG: FG-GAP repeat protein, partial [Planctomycetota bacterium]